MRRPRVIHPFIMAVFPVLFLYSHNMDITPFSEILAPAVVVLGFTLLVLGLLRVVLKDSIRAGILTTIGLILFFSYGHIFYSVFYGLEIRGIEVGRQRYILPFYSAVSVFIISAFALTLKTHPRMNGATNFLNVLSSALVAMSLVNIGIYSMKKPEIAWLDKSIESARIVGSSPDIYYIVPDMYASSSTLRKIYGYDNRSFIESLEKMGFYVADKSRSNYAFTDLSLASSLNMEYINYLGDRLGAESRDKSILHRMIRDSRVWQFLKSRGYRYIHFHSGWGATQRNRLAQVNYFLYSFPSEFTQALFDTTVLSVFFSNYYAEVIHRNQILFSFEKLPEVADIEGPTFAFAHLLVPHPPYVFGRDGELVKQIGVRKEDKGRYLDQVIFVENKIKETVAKILAKSETPPVIVIQADHGPDLTGDLKNPTDELLRERFNIFNAYYLPEYGNNLLYESITPVNSFRLIFNRYFGTKYDLLEDISYFSEYNHPYEFVTVGP